MYILLLYFKIIKKKLKIAHINNKINQERPEIEEDEEFLLLY